MKSLRIYPSPGKNPEKPLTAYINSDINDIMKFQVLITEEANEFLDSLPVKMEAKARRTIDLLRKYGYMLPEPHSKKLKTVGEIHELRVKLGNDICRMFYFYWKERIYVITSGYVKKSDRTDVNEISRAMRIMNDIKGR